jgi:serine O-acetyltransferase
MEFNFISYLKADLSRARGLQGITIDPIHPMGIWMGIFSPRFFPVLLCRLAYLFYRYRLIPLAKAVSLLNFFLFGIEVGIKCEIGKGIFFPHTSGTVIGALSIGKNATIYQGVTIGARELDFCYLEASRPIIGDDVVISTGAVILGAVRIGDRSRIGANSVVLTSIPDDVLAVGAPARVIERFS